MADPEQHELNRLMDSFRYAKKNRIVCALYVKPSRLDPYKCSTSKLEPSEILPKATSKFKKLHPDYDVHNLPRFYLYQIAFSAVEGISMRDSGVVYSIPNYCCDRVDCYHKIYTDCIVEAMEDEILK